jgi:hypothetical protein
MSLDMYHTHFYFLTLIDGIGTVFLSVLDYIHVAHVTGLWAAQSGLQNLSGTRDFFGTKNGQFGFGAQAAANSMHTGVLARSNLSRV